MSNNDHFGPIGILWTDDPTADRRQIKAESWDEEGKFPFRLQTVDPGEYSGGFYSTPPDDIKVHCGCHSCLFGDIKWIEDTPESIAEQNKRWQEEHAATNCKDELIIGNI